MGEYHCERNTPTTHQVVQRRHAAAGTSRSSAGRTTRACPVVRKRLGALAAEGERARGTRIAALSAFPAGRESRIEVVFLVLLGGASGLGCKVVLDRALQLEIGYVGLVCPWNTYLQGHAISEEARGVGWGRLSDGDKLVNVCC